MHARLFAVLLILASVGAPLAAAAPGPSPDMLPQTPRFVHAELSLAQPNLTTLQLTGDLWAYRYDVDGDVYDADDIADAYHGANKYSKKVGSAFIADVEQEVRAALERTLADSFPGDTVRDVRATVDVSSLRASGGNPYDPPVHVSVAATVLRTRESVGLGDLSDDAVAAAFDAGARVAADFTLTAENGYKVVYALGAPAGLRWEPGAQVDPTGSRFTVTVDNGAGQAPSVDASGRLFDPTVTPPAAEDIRSTLDVSMGEIVTGAAGIPIQIDVRAEVRALDVARRFPNALPEKVILPFVNADGVRALYATGAIDDADLAGADDALLAQLRQDVERTFGAGATASGGLARAAVSRAAAAPFSADPPLEFLADARTTYEVPGIDADDMDLALRIGGAANVVLQLAPVNGRATTYTIHPPAAGEFTQAEGGSVSVNGQTATFVVPDGEERVPVKLHLRGRDVPTFTASDASIDVVIDIADLDTGLGKALSGDLGNMLVNVKVAANLRVIELPDEARGSMPSQLELRFVSSDAIRLLVDRGYLSTADLAKLEARLASQVAEKLSAALGGDLQVASGFDRTTLAASLVSTPISGDKPIVFEATTRVAKPLAGGPAQTQAAIALYTKELPLTLRGVPGFDTVYTVIAPRGLAITGVSGDGVEQGKSPDGRDMFTVRPGDEPSQVSVAMAVTPGFVAAKFWPVVLLAVVLLVLIIGTPVALVVMKRRKGKTASGQKK